MPAIENDGAMDVEENEMRAKRQPPLTTVHQLEDIPQFASEAEEHAFWATHELDEALWEQAEPFGPDELPPPRSATQPVAIRFDEHTLARLKRLARKRHKGYQTLLGRAAAPNHEVARLDDEPLWLLSGTVL